MADMTKTCLVVDDSRVARLVARRILEEMSFIVQEAEDGEQALALCRESLPDAILLDWHMPVIDGPAFLRSLRHSQGGERPKVVFCTSQNDPEQIAAVIQEGADEYIMKPFDRDILREKFAGVGLV